MLYVLTGGARSGKSSAAEALAARLGGSVIVAAAGSATDLEMRRRIEAHRAGRPGSWRTEEIPVASEWRARPQPGETLLLECVGTLVARIMDEAAADAGLVDPWQAPELPPPLAEEVDRRVRAALESCIVAGHGCDGMHVVAVTNEVGDGVVPEWPSGRLFRDAMGRANRLLVDDADAAWLVVAGRCLNLTALPTTPAPDARATRTED